MPLSRAWNAVREKVLGQRLVKDVGILTIGQFIGAILSFGQGVLVARWLGPELYGLAAAVMSYPALIFSIFDARSVESSIKYMGEFHARNERDRVLAVCKLGYVVDFAIALLAFLIVLFTATWAAQKVAHRSDMVGFIIVSAVAFFPRSFVGTSHAVLATASQFSLIAWIEIVTTLTRVISVLAMTFLGWQVAGIVWGNALAVAVNGLLYAASAHALVKRTWGASWLRGAWRSLSGHGRGILGFLTYTNLIALLGMVPKQLDLVLLAYFRNPTEVGYYKLAKSLSGVVGHLVGPLQSVIYPKLVRKWSMGVQQGMKREIQRLAVLGLLLGSAVLAGIPLMPVVISRLVGPAYIPAIPASQLLFLGSAVWLAFFWIRPLYFVKRELLAWTVISIMVICLSILGFLTVIPQQGFLGLALVMALMHIIGNGMAAIYAIWWWSR